VDSLKRGIVQLEVERHDHQGLQVDGVLTIIDWLTLRTFIMRDQAPVLRLLTG